MAPRVVAVVAAHDAEDSVGATVEALQALGLGEPVVVVDDASRDRTADRARAAGANVIQLDENVGKGGAVRAGVAAAAHADVYLLVDADTGTTAGGARPLLEPVVGGEADMTIGVLPPADGRAGVGLVKRLARTAIRRATGRRVEAPLSGQRAVRGELLRSLTLAERFGLETAMTLDALRSGARVVEVGVDMDHRHTGRSAAGFAHRAKQGRDIVRALWPRVSSARARVALIVAALVVALAAAVWSGDRAIPQSVAFGGAPQKVLVVGMPGLSLSDVETGRFPELDRVARSGVVGAMSIRTLSQYPSAVEGYATLGAGARVRVDPSGAATIDALVSANRGRHVSSYPGALGAALHRAGKRTGVLGDPETAAALLDRRGAIDDVGGGVDAVADADVVVAGVGRAGPAADRALGELVASVPPRTRIIVLSVVPPTRQWQLTPVVVAGEGTTAGQVRSPSTRRAGLITLTDVGPTILDAVGVPVPAGMVGHGMRQKPGPSHLADLVTLDRLAVFRERIYFRIALGFIVSQALIYAAAMLVLSRRRILGRSTTALRGISLLIAGFPLSTFVFRALPDSPRFGSASFAVMLAIDAVLVASVWRLRAHRLQALGWLLAVTAAVLLVDLSTGARLQEASVMGYSPHTATRFYGIGNTAFAILAATVIFPAAIHLERAPRGAEALVAVGALFVLAIVVDGAPMLGDDVGGVLTLVPVLGLLLVAFSGRRLTLRSIVVVAGITLVMLVGATAVDLLRPPETRTHLGRLAADVQHHGISPLATIAQRKAATNIRVLRATIWTWMVPIIAIFMLYLLMWQRRWAELLPPKSPRRAGLIAALAAGLLGFAVNDSGVVVTAMVFVYVGPFMTLLALR